MYDGETLFKTKELWQYRRKVSLHITFLALVRYYHITKYEFFCCCQNNEEEMGPSTILSVIHIISIGTMLNFNGNNNGHGLKNVTCKETCRIQRIFEEFACNLFCLILVLKLKALPQNIDLFLNCT